MEISRLSAPNKAAKSRAHLREFQTQLAKRIRDAGAAPATQPRLALRLDQLNVLIDLGETGEIIAVPPMTRVPRTQPWYLGIANIRGNLIGVVDAGLMLRGQPTSLEPNSRAILFAPALRINVAVLATRVLGLRNLADFTWQEASGLAPGLQDFATAQYVDAAGGQWTELSLALLAESEKFLQIGA